MVVPSRRVAMLNSDIFCDQTFSYNLTWPETLVRFAVVELLSNWQALADRRVRRQVTIFRETRRLITCDASLTSRLCFWESLFVSLSLPQYCND